MFDEAAVTAAAGVAESAIEDVAQDGRGAIVVSSVAGAGKSHLVAQAAGRLADDGATIVATCPTNAQAHGLVDRIAELNPSLEVAFCPASGQNLPPAIAARSNVVEVEAKSADQHELLVATMDKLRDMRGRELLGERDRLLLDEAYQADSARYFGVAGLAERHLVVGDSGQLEPFTSAPEAERWRGLREDPIQSAVSVLLGNHPTTVVHRLPVTRRLDPRAIQVVQAFYPGHHVAAAVQGGVRRLELAAGAATSPAGRASDHALDQASTVGWTHLVLPAAPTLTADPEIARTIAGLILRLLERDPRVRCEHLPKGAALDPARIAVGVSHRDQRRLIRSLLDDVGLGAVTCDTANRLQGLQFDVVVVWHPLAGLPDADAFHLDPGRLAVLLTRHRHACIVVGREGDADLVSGIPPATPAFVGVAGDSVLDGFEVHAEVFHRLNGTRVSAPAPA